MVDERYAPAPGLNVHLITTCEAAIELLEQRPAHQLWIRTDVSDVHGIWSLIDYFVGEGPWEGRPQIDEIVIFCDQSETGYQTAHELYTLLNPHYKVRNQFVGITTEHFAIHE
jgi:hypothetical protein